MPIQLKTSAVGSCTGKFLRLPGVALRSVLLLFALTLLPDLAAADRQTHLLSKFRYTRLARLPENDNPGPDTPLAIRLDSEFYANIDDLNNDLRIVNAEGRLVEFVLSKATGSADISSVRQLSGKIIREQALPDGSFAIDFELGAANIDISTVELAGLQTRPDTQLSIVIGDGRNWQTAVRPITLSNIAQWPEITARTFPFPKPLQGKIVRVILHNGKYEKLEAVRVYTPEIKRQPESAIQTDYPISEIRSGQENNVHIIELQSDHQPLTQLKFNIPNKFFRAQVTILGSNDRKEWNIIANSVIHRIDMDNINTVDFPEHRSQYLQVKIDSDPAGEIINSARLQARGNVYDWVLSSTQETRQNLMIYYGADSQVPVRNQTAIVSGHGGQFFVLAPRQNNKLYKTWVQDRRNWRYLAGTILVLAGGIVIFILLRKIKPDAPDLPAD